MAVGAMPSSGAQEYAEPVVPEVATRVLIISLCNQSMRSGTNWPAGPATRRVRCRVLAMALL
jgi:hypothetical protein